MKIRIIAEVSNPADEDRKHLMGITNEAFERICDALYEIDFTVQDIQVDES